MFQQLKRCHTASMSNVGMRRKAAYMLVYSPCVAAFAASRLVSAAWTFSAVAVLRLVYNRTTAMCNL
ncbi:hypothetical protein RJ639_047469 [Escallonia herrerae]|uniref:Uncharacterized protein n=1 Tax=Escallonia herrerae TaxID=1293975 RepID=A0AA88W605_9ASTE|nr:hypothetical protein RJ639_047469 [Escallonia herrerae]